MILAFLCVAFFVLLFVWTYADKVFCSFLNAKKVAPNSNDTFRHVVNRKSDISDKNQIDLYLYDGGCEKVFILDSAAGQTILIDEDLFKSLNKRESFLLYDELEMASQLSEVKLLTKFYAILSIIFKLIRPFKKGPLWVRYFPSIIISSLVYPFVLVVFNKLKQSSPKRTSEVVEKYSSSDTFVEFLDIYGLQLDSRQSVKKKMIAFLESQSTFDFLRGNR